MNPSLSVPVNARRIAENEPRPVRRPSFHGLLHLANSREDIQSDGDLVIVTVTIAFEETSFRRGVNGPWEIL